MRTVHTPVYKFDELSDAAKQTAIEKLYDINVSFDWWDSIYDDANTIGCKIKGFDTDRGSYCDLRCDDAHETARLIMENHGSKCDTCKLAAQYCKDREKIIEEAERDEDGELADEYAVDKLLDELNAEFQRALGEEYLSMLRQEYEYLTSEEAIIETIEANEYEFTEDGKMF
ncbi:hypothetical protein M0Q28_05625 [Patescibacteria group bacterium]|jgi:hypothetical protein|nr:hypothetical protein [Patescibacteria group bacterium]